MGYDGLEVAPYTLSDAPHRLTAGERAQVRRAADEAGIAIIGLHWLLVAPKGLSITAPDAAIRRETVGVMRHLIDLCADLGGGVMVHGSPAQRKVAPGDTLEAAWARARDCFAQIAEHAGAAGVSYCIEPLARTETQLVNTLEDAARLVSEVGHAAVGGMIDTSSAGRTESLGVAEVNDSNRRGPGQGDDLFAPVFAALQRNGYGGVVSVEPFDYRPDGQATAARAIGYIRGILETLAARPK